MGSRLEFYRATNSLFDMPLITIHHQVAIEEQATAIIRGQVEVVFAPLVDFDFSSVPQRKEVFIVRPAWQSNAVARFRLQLVQLANVLHGDNPISRLFSSDRRLINKSMGVTANRPDSHIRIGSADRSF